MDFAQRLACICLVGAAFALLTAECAPTSGQDKLLELLKKLTAERNEDQQGWKSLSEWSVCTRSCGGGIQTRHRMCTKTVGKCEGDPYEQRECNTFRCAAKKISSLTSGKAKPMELLKELEVERSLLRQTEVVPCKDEINNMFSNEFHCTPTTCIPKSLRCNGVDNCPNGSDEDDMLCYLLELSQQKESAKREDVVGGESEMPVSNDNGDRSSRGELNHLLKRLLNKLEKEDN